MKILKTKFKELKEFESKIYLTQRFFRELFIKKKTKNNLIFTVTSKSKKCITWFAYANKKQQGKYITVVKGKILDVCVDCRKNQKHLANFIK